MVYTMAQLDYPVQNMLDKVWAHCEWGASLCRTHKSSCGGGQRGGAEGEGGAAGRPHNIGLVHH